MNIRLNIAFKNIKDWGDSKKREDHVLDRMQLRGIGKEQIIDAINKGAKHLRKDGVITAEYRWFKVLYREFIIKDIKKIYPITVMEA